MLTLYSDTRLKDIGPTLTLDELCAQAFGFFIAAYETTSSMLTYILYHVARSPEVQGRLHRELDQVLQEHSGEVRYESIMKMTYMTQVIKGKRSTSFDIKLYAFSRGRNCTNNAKMCKRQRTNRFFQKIRSLFLDKKFPVPKKRFQKKEKISIIVILKLSR